jgi:hypothetical protein
MKIIPHPMRLSFAFYLARSWIDDECYEDATRTLCELLEYVRVRYVQSDGKPAWRDIMEQIRERGDHLSYTSPILDDYDETVQ